jgi:type IV secretory pathway VirB4 component
MNLRSQYTLVLSLLMLMATTAFAQDRIWRCGNSYTNTVSDEQARNCRLVSGGNVTVVQAVRPNSSNTNDAVRVASAPTSSQRMDSTEQRAKDNDARLILESELKKAEAMQEQLLKEFNNGEPEKLGTETRNHQKYLDRVAELKATISRNEADIAGIRRELGRFGVVVSR